MPKAEKFSPKDIANRMKAKGLQKLRWYCQMCEKQCRDENGYRNHINSESHQRQMVLFTSNSSKYIEDFSKDFMSGYVGILSRRYGTTRVFANQVYQEYISDRHHVHMNSTRWATLTEFILYLSRRGIVKADETERGWFVQWIDNSPEELSRQDAIRKQDRQKKDQEERDRILIEGQIAAASRTASFTTEMPPIEFKKEADIKIPLPFKNDGRISKTEKIKKSLSIFEDSEEDKPSDNQVLEESWLATDIIVKVLSKNFASGRYFKKKGQISKVIDDFIAEIKLLDEPRDVIRIDQNYLETVIPAIGGSVMILKGDFKLEVGILRDIDTSDCSASILLKNGKMLERVDFEWFSKVAS